MMIMEIRLATKTDLKSLISIKQEFNEEYGISKSNSFISRELSNYLGKGIIIIAESDSKIVGYLAGIIEKNLYETTGYIEEIFVSKPFRHRGISTRLKDRFIEFLKSKGICICRIDVNPDNPALAIYKKWGFNIDKYRMSLRF
ncbi:MAG: hypothetical protein PWQ28_640 [Candidatus Woesearchaeota archaeon]|nr:hypothetical protein [Candidatus Woesearchaeota archaeon]